MLGEVKPLNQKRFNSQRDGILPNTLKVFAMKKGVSIPNGMEFYLYP